MLGLSRKRTATPKDAAATVSSEPEAGASPAGEYESLLQAFQVLETATLSLDGITHSLSEARMLARIASRPAGAAQRGLIAGRYAVIRGEIETRSRDAALKDSDRLMVVLGGTEDGRQGSLVTRSLPASRFESPDEVKAVIKTMDFALKAIEDEATLLREAAGRVADRLAECADMVRTAPAETAPAKAEATAPVAQTRTGKSRKAA